ncbi:hypothetical protein BWI17_00085 [Betaproteobacteria bacterium GR16-43]|nr:hypothetical protein BWI17_00085 [Betaproteobacteria bacterium GR16-43]
MNAYRFMAAALAALAGSAHGAAGQLDIAFGEGGIAALPVSTVFSGTVHAIEIEPAGRVIASGVVQTRFAANTPSFIAAFLPDGRLDTTYADGGARPSSLEPIATGNFSDGIFLRLRPDGSMIQGHRRLALEGGPLFKAERVLPNGSVAPGYGSATVNLDAPSPVLLEDGSLVVGGMDATDSFVAGFDPQGQVDSRWTSNRRAFDCGHAQPLTRIALARAPGNKVLVAQSLNISVPPTLPAFCISRLQADGSLDTTYGTAGHSVVADPRLVQVLRAGTVTKVLAQSDGGAIVVYVLPVLTYPDPPVLVFITPEGRLDTARGDNGIRPLTGIVADVALQPDGKILVTGNPATGSAPPVVDYTHPYLARFTRNGTADLTFGGGSGAVTLATASNVLLPLTLRVADGGAIFVGGTASLSSPPVAFVAIAVAKVQGDPPPPPPPQESSASGGGCGYTDRPGPPDPTLPMIALVAVMMLILKKWHARLRGNGGGSCTT